MSDQPTVLLTGATGYVGGRLRCRLTDEPVRIRCITRNPDRVSSEIRFQSEVVAADVDDFDSLGPALNGIETAYYLIHSMGLGDDFIEKDRRGAVNFGRVAKEAGVRRIIYLGGLGKDDRDLSPHLRSRHEVGEVLRQSGVETIELRASVVVGAGSLSYEMVRSLTERLPVMLCPRWLKTPTQPIAIDDVVAYLIEARTLPVKGSRIYEIGGTDVIDYGGLIREYARQRGLKRIMIYVPVLTPYLSSLWLGLITPENAEVGRHLIEGLRNPTVVHDRTAETDFTVRPIGVEEATRRALAG